jgi:hypothetical protein
MSSHSALGRIPFAPTPSSACCSLSEGHIQERHRPPHTQAHDHVCEVGDILQDEGKHQDCEWVVGHLSILNFPALSDVRHAGRQAGKG